MAQPPSDPTSTSTGRRIDAAVVLPAIGAVLVFVPLLWPEAQADADSDGVKTSVAAIYLFAVWAVMILGAAWLSFILRPQKPSDAADD